MSQKEELNLRFLEACGRGDETVARELNSMKVDVLAKDRLGTTAGDLAVSKGHLNILRLLVETSLDTNTNKLDSWLYQSLRQGHLAVAKLLRNPARVSRVKVLVSSTPQLEVRISRSQNS